MNGREVLLFSMFASFLVVVAALVFLRAKGGATIARRRLDLIEQALRDPSTDAATRALLLRSLAREHSSGFTAWLWAGARNPTVWRTLWFGTGWILFLVFGGALAAASMGLLRFPRVEDVLPVAIAGFAMITLPTALRELTRRGGAATLDR